jgi:two-component system alkaline phosphatase synthesis response regulator PhoP
MAEAQKKILLVDDDAQIHDLYKTRLKLAGFTVLEAWNGKEGIEVAKKEKPDFILLDVLMPVMDGPRALLEMKEDEELKNIPVLILTGLEDRPIDVRVAKEVGAVDFINKAVEFKELIARIKGTLKIE